MTMDSVENNKVCTIKRISVHSGTDATWALHFLIPFYQQYQRDVWVSVFDDNLIRNP
jgi:hypothetical protein